MRALGPKKMSFMEMASLAALSSIVGGVTISAVKKPQEAKTAQIMSAQRNKIEELRAKIEFMEKNGGGAGGAEGVRVAGEGDGVAGDGARIEREGMKPGWDEGARMDNTDGRGENENAGVADEGRCADELGKCRAREIGQFMNSLYMCGKMADAALYLKSIRNTVSCNTSRQIHSLIGLGLEKCEDARAVSQSAEQKNLIDKEVRRLEVLRADKKVNPAGCVKGK